MKTQAIDASEWKSFADRFSQTHQGWLASLEIRQGHQPLRVEVDESPFRGAKVEMHDGHPTLAVTFGEEPEETFVRTIANPASVLTSEADDRSEISLIIETSDGSRCILDVWHPSMEGRLAEL